MLPWYIIHDPVMERQNHSVTCAACGTRTVNICTLIQSVCDVIFVPIACAVQEELCRGFLVHSERF